jgi:hypothetical protein
MAAIHPAVSPHALVLSARTLSFRHSKLKTGTYVVTLIVYFLYQKYLRKGVFNKTTQVGPVRGFLS